MYSDLELPLQPPQPVFAESWQHNRMGSSGGSYVTSEEGTRPSLEQSQKVGRAGFPTGRQMEQPLHDNSSVASLPPGVGLEDPVTPAEFAINVLYSRFLTLAGVRVRGAIGGVDEPGVLLASAAQGVHGAC